MEENPMKVLREPATALYPTPVVLVSCGVDKPNLITLAWAGVACSEPPVIGIGVRPGRFSHGLIAEVGEFVVNIPGTDQVGLVDYCGQVSGRDTDKWADCGLTPVPASQVRVPLVAEFPVAIECRVIQRVSLGSHDLFLGQVVAVQVEGELVTADGRLDYLRAQPLAYVGVEYRQVGGLLGRNGDWRPTKRKE
jgi:flavin reductase (DIM6/NTAB) family NADH-FMN oxidoreductase RutF